MRVNVRAWDRERERAYERYCLLKLGGKMLEYYCEHDYKLFFFLKKLQYKNTADWHLFLNYQYLVSLQYTQNPGEFVWQNSQT